MKAGAPLTPDSPISALRGVGPALAERLERMGLRRVQDLLFHLPSRYQDRRHIHPMASLQPGMEAAVEGEILDVEHLRGRREQWLVRLADGSGQMQLRLFHLHGAMRGQWRRGRRLWCFGELRTGFHGLEMVHPEWAMADTADFQAPQHLTPFYPSTE
ncbi:MAG: ATP-dependent DNA helicase RecG, partial [Acidithiobacillus ferrivorans]